MPKWLFEDQFDGLRLSFAIKKTLLSKRSRFQKIDIIESFSHGKILSLDKKIMVTESDEFIYHEMISHIPLFFHNNPRRILIIGGGDGGTARECSKHPSIEKVDLCEIDGDVIKFSKKFLPFVSCGLSNEKVDIFVEDGFVFLENAHKQGIKYDIILIDSSDPVGIAAVLFKENFYQLAKKCLKKNGIICGQCESPFFFSKSIKDADNNLKSIFRYVLHYSAPVPTYPSGYWSFVIASDRKLIFQSKRHSQLKNLIKCKYYNEEIHKGAFLLPNFFKKLIGN